MFFARDSTRAPASKRLQAGGPFWVHLAASILFRRAVCPKFSNGASAV